MNTNDRKLLLQIFSNALEKLTGEYLVESARFVKPVESNEWRVIAIGKAAASMACGAIDCFGRRNISQLLVITKPGHVRPWLSRLTRAEILESAHPVPDLSSLRAGQRLLEVIRQPSSGAFLFLISGGASSLVEVLHPDIQLADLQRVNRWLQAKDIPVHTVNAVRSRLSLIKGGKLLRYLTTRPGCVLLLSDVQGDDPGSIGSGLLSTTREDVSLPEVMPAWLERLLPAADTGPQPPAMPNHVIGNLQTALKVVADIARQTGLPVTVFDDELAGPAVVAGKEMAACLCRVNPGIYIRGGETTVELPQSPGRGGRNQQFALAAATQLTGRDDIHLLALGTDGDDGNTDDAGALVDGYTLARGMDAGLHAGKCLQRADAGSFLEASGDLVTTGATGTNLRDLVIAIKR